MGCATKTDRATLLTQDPTAIVTTLIDYYGVLTKHMFPQWEHSKTIVDRNLRLSHIENAMLESINESLRWRFLPYIQLHEFEGLLFNNIDSILSSFPASEIRDIEELQTILSNFLTPN